MPARALRCSFGAKTVAAAKYRVAIGPAAGSHS
jgi:hypothetical protein